MIMTNILLNTYNDILLLVMIAVMLIIFIGVLYTNKALKTMMKVTMPEVLAEQKAQKAAIKAERKASGNTWWNKLMGLRPMEEEKDLLIEHEYDGIRELDNPIPIWFNAMFYASIVFAVVYLLIYHVFHWAPLQDEEYQIEMARAELAKQEWLAQSANNIDETNVEVDASPAVISAGLALYTANCAVCHGGAGEGGIGPNLTDDYWIHGGEIGDVFSVIKYGVIDKGMIPWEQSLTPGQIAELSNYILTLRGTNPPNPKEPQGEKVEYQTGGGAPADAADAPAEGEEADAHTVADALQQG